ncbi:MAG: recombination mediator RecR [Candidatus Omnitrophica bacterium]|nr:recombination mediator RecR [Candidatus Omnitrophota bacterium]MCM8777791.1 recombination mediator RecR [Candidatus Omnitrophota bacterium]
MNYYPEKVEKLIEKLIKFPGIGPRSAERITHYIISEKEDIILSLAENLISVKKEVHLCKKCFNLSESEVCSICRDEKRERTLCVVEEVKDLVLIEKAGFKGLYHVLGGSISPLEKISPDKLTIPQLIERLKEEPVQEVIIATNPTPEGENTATYISEILKGMGIKHSRLGCGLPVGAEIEYVGTQTLKRAIEERKAL